jgi:hypothetical protein
MASATQELIPLSNPHFWRRRILMAEQQIRFDDGAAYERMMGT